MPVRSATAVPEKEIVRWAFGFHTAISWLLPFVFRSRQCLIAFEVGEPVIPGGDRKSAELDVLILPEHDHASAIAVEAKRARIDASTLLTERVGGLRAIHEAAAQTNARIEQGFAESYLAILLQVDARTFCGGRWHQAVAPAGLAAAVRSQISAAGLHPDAGYLLFQIGQPADKDVLLGGGFGLSDHRVATPRPQDPNLTRRLDDFVAGLATRPDQ